MADNLALVRTLIGALLLIDAAIYLPHFRLFFGDRYHSASFLRRRWGRILVFLLWVAGSLALIFGVAPVIAAAILVVVFRYFFISTRWTSLLRGGGVPGYMTHYAVLVIFLLELAKLIGGGSSLFLDVLRMIRVDFACIVLCAGLYKALSGYLQGEGVEYALVNPIWSYGWRFFRRLPPYHWFFKVESYAAVLFEIIVGVALLVPSWAVLGAALCILSFASLLPMIRLGRLIGVMMTIPLLLLPALPWAPPWQDQYSLAPMPLPGVSGFLSAATFVYIGALAATKVMQYVNLFLNKSFPAPLQAALERFARAVPVVMWRVFTPDITNFYVFAEWQGTDGRRQELIGESSYAYGGLRTILKNWRFHQVAESAAIAAIFTARKYFRSRPEIFQEKLVRYARTLTAERGGSAVFRYISITKSGGHFRFVPATSFSVDLESGAVSETPLLEGFDSAAPARFSHIREGKGYGTYLKRS